MERRYLNKPFYSGENPIFIQSANSKLIKKELKKQGYSVSEKNLREYLDFQKLYSKFKHIAGRRNFKRNHFFSNFPFKHVEADLMELGNLAKFNSAYKYILVVIDVFTKYAFAEPIKNKTAKTVTAAFKKIYEENFDERTKHIEFLRSDQGRELISNEFNNYLQSKEITHFLVNSTNLSKAVFIERFIRSIRELITRYCILDQIIY